MTLYISREVGVTFFRGFNFFLSQLTDVVGSLFHISIGGVSIGIIWLSLSVMLTVIALTVKVVNSGAGNTAGTGAFYSRVGNMERRRSNTMYTTYPRSHRISRGSMVTHRVTKMTRK